MGQGQQGSQEEEEMQKPLLITKVLPQPEQIYLLFACDVANFANMDGLNAVRCNNTRRLRIINNHHAQI